MVDSALLQQKAKRLASLIEVSTIINSSLKLETVIRLVMDKAQEVMNAEAVSVLLYDAETERLEVQSASGAVGSAIKEKITLGLGQGIAGWVAQERETLNIADAQNDPRFFREADKLTGFQTLSILAAPLLFKDRLIGVAEVINRKDGKSFSEEDQDLFITFCRSVAMAVENARLHHEMLEKERMQQQLQSAQAIQQSFLPQTIPQCPRMRFDISAIYSPARAIGGDFYDFIELDEDRIGIVVGDVCGKGIPAALYMAHVLNDLRFLARPDISPSETVAKLNDQMVEKSHHGLFVTLAYGILDVEHGVLNYVNAGHVPLFRVRSANNQFEVFAKANQIPLGIRRNLDYPQMTLNLDPGDYLVMLTDGILEARTAEAALMDEDKLAKILSREWDSAKALADTVIGAITHPGQQRIQHDDWTLVAVKWH